MALVTVGGTIGRFPEIGDIASRLWVDLCKPDENLLHFEGFDRPGLSQTAVWALPHRGGQDDPLIAQLALRQAGVNKPPVGPAAHYLWDPSEKTTFSVGILGREAVFSLPTGPCVDLIGGIPVSRKGLDTSNGSPAVNLRAIRRMIGAIRDERSVCVAVECQTFPPDQHQIQPIKPGALVVSRETQKPIQAAAVVHSTDPDGSLKAVVVAGRRLEPPEREARGIKALEPKAGELRDAMQEAYNTGLEILNGRKLTTEDNGRGKHGRLVRVLTLAGFAIQIMPASTRDGHPGLSSNWSSMGSTHKRDTGTCF